MRADCKHHETRTYASGETVRKCNLDLAPDAPWRCPAECASFERRLADVAWEHGSLITPPTPEEPPGIEDGSAAALLDEAENIVNAALAGALSEIGQRPRGGSGGSGASDVWWRRFRFGRRR